MNDHHGFESPKVSSQGKVKGLWQHDLFVLLVCVCRSFRERYLDECLYQKLVDQVPHCLNDSSFFAGMFGLSAVPPSLSHEHSFLNVPY